MPEDTLTSLLVAAARARPEAVAIRQWDRVVTYAELLDRATQLASQLEHGDPGDLIGICTARTPEMVIAVYGTLLAGRAYVPLDPANPPARLAGLASQAHLSTVIADAGGREALVSAGLSFVDVPAVAPHTDWRPGPATPDSLAYVSFTSGSTGRPKGVRVTHRNVVQFVFACRDLARVTPDDHVLGLTSLGFDAVVADLFVSLISGASLALMPHADRVDPARLNRFARAHEVTFGVTTPPVLSLLDPDAIPTLHTLITGGEALTASLAQQWAKRRLINVYGPTETTVFVLAADLSTLDYQGDPPLGTPVGDHRAYVVDEGLRPVPDEVVGELLIGGPGVALGYLDEPELTAERFLPDPLRPDETCYRTGDLVRRDADGLLWFHGRRDTQVKIRGVRIEPDEVAAVLREHRGVRDVVVEAIPDATGTLSLVAFIVAEDDEEAALRDYAHAHLSDAMVPSRYLFLPELPIALTGKVDRRALRAMASGPPAPIETDDPIAHAWAQVLGRVPEPQDDFFALGGHSIAAMRLVAELRERLGRDLAVEDVFTARTFGRLTQRVAEAPELTGKELSFGHPPTLSPSQRRLWFLDQLAPDSSAYNVVFAERLRGDLDIDTLRRALRTVQERHEVVRWRILDHNGVPYAVCDPPSDVDIWPVDIAAADLEGALARTAAGRFDLATGPLWRAALFRISPAEHVLCLVFHHAVADGWSQAPLYADLSAAYAGHPLAPLPATYADYATWRAARDAERADADESWWREHLADAPTVLDLPRDHHRPAVQTYSGAGASRSLTEEGDAAVRAMAAASGATPSVVALAAIGQALARWADRDDNVIGAVLADRRRSEFQNLIGFFVDVVPLRLRLGHETFGEQVRASLEELLAAQAHPGVALERIVEALGLRRDPARAPLVQVLFNVFNFAQPRLELLGLISEPVPVAMPGSPFDLTFYLLERDGRLGFDVVYNPDLFTEGRITRMLDDLVALLEALCLAPQAPAREIGPALDPVGVVDPARADVAYVHRPATQTETALIAIWREVLAASDVSAADNFFDLGGTSLALAEVRSRLQARLNREVPMVDLFRYPNIRSLASYLDGAGGEDELARAIQRAALRRSRAHRRGPRERDGDER